jgi:hypothetical protein
VNVLRKNYDDRVSLNMGLFFCLIVLHHSMVHCQNRRFFGAAATDVADDTR